MPSSLPITIVGGGLAGLALGIGLRQHRVPVQIWEAGHYPRHRVCGEFLSGLGWEVLGQLGLQERCLAAGGRWAHTVAFFRGSRALGSWRLPRSAFCLSRFALEELLAREFERLGGQLVQNRRWNSDYFGAGMVRATGRRLAPSGRGSSCFALKVHARNIALAADLEMHVLPHGYVGLCRLGPDRVNVCGLFWRPPDNPRGEVDGPRAAGRPCSDTSSSRQDQPGPFSETALSAIIAPLGEGRNPWNPCARTPLRGPVDSILHQRLARAVLLPGTDCAKAGLNLGNGRRLKPADCCLGDAFVMTPPLTGNGMSLALESAVLAREPLAAYSRGELSWPLAQEQLVGACNRRFHRRLVWAARLQWWAQSRLGRTLLCWTVRHASLARLLFNLTR